MRLCSACTTGVAIVWLLSISGCGGPSLDPFASAGSSSGGGDAAGTLGGGGGNVVSDGGSAGQTSAAGSQNINTGGTTEGGGGGATAGASAAGRSAVVEPGSACFGHTQVPEALLANCETGMKGWFGYTGGSSTPVTELHPGAEDSITAADFHGGYAESAGMGISMFCDDVSSYDGVSFWAKGRGDDHVRFLVAVPGSDAKPGRGDCDPAQVKCNDHPGKALVLTDTWTKFTVTWDELAQYGWGEPAQFTGIANSVLWINDGTVDSFDFAIDDVTLVKTAP